MINLQTIQNSKPISVIGAMKLDDEAEQNNEDQKT